MSCAIALMAQMCSSRASLFGDVWRNSNIVYSFQNVANYQYFAWRRLMMNKFAHITVKTIVIIKPLQQKTIHCTYKKDTCNQKTQFALPAANTLDVWQLVHLGTRCTVRWWQPGGQIGFFDYIYITLVVLVTSWALCVHHEPSSLIVLNVYIINGIKTGKTE